MPRGYYPRKPKAPKEPTFTSIVENWMKQQDDFVTLDQIKAGTTLNTNRVSACLTHFYRRKVVDFIVSDGKTYWYATPDTDDRTRVVEEKVPEEQGSRKPRSVRVNNTK